jgi:hypothetical protein
MITRWPLLILRSKDQWSNWTWKYTYHSLSLEPFDSNLIHRYIVKNQWHLLIFRSKDQGSNLPKEYTDCSLSWKLCAWQTSNLVHWYITKSRWPHMILKSKVKGQTGHTDVLTTLYLENPLLYRLQISMLKHVHLKKQTINPFWFGV